MTLRLHNTLSGRVEAFVPLARGRVTFYTCGPTVYDFAHIGNFRSFLVADLLRRWLESPLCARVEPDGSEAGPPGGYEVVQVMNITDVGHMTDDDQADGGGEDKMEAARKRLLEDKKSGRLPPGTDETLDPNDPYVIADFFADAFLEDARALGLKVVADAEADPSLMPRPSRVVAGMLRLVLTLLDRGHAYVGADGTAYFDTQSFPDYGKLSGNTIDRIRSGAGGRVSDATQQVKRHPADFMLWKPDPAHLMRWDPVRVLADEPALADKARAYALGEGYPGWHLECSVMAQQRLGEVIDLHSGGEDNIFPHHECEIAQSRCATGRDAFARCWVHTRFLQVEGEKMSKSTGNFFTLRDLLQRGFTPGAIRLELIKTHYRMNANFTEQGLRDSQRMITRWSDFLSRAGEADAGAGPVKSVCEAFAAAMNDDLNVSAALGAINSWIRDTPEPGPREALTMRLLDDVLGVLSLASGAQGAGADDEETARIDELVRRRQEARAAKDWAEADRIRDELAALSVVVEDSPEGATWHRKAEL